MDMIYYVFLTIAGVSYTLLTDAVADTSNNIDSAFDLPIWKNLGVFLSMLLGLVGYYIFHRNTARFSEDMFS